MPSTARPEAIPPRRNGALGIDNSPTKSLLYALTGRVAPVSQITEKCSSLLSLLNMLFESISYVFICSLELNIFISGGYISCSLLSVSCKCVEPTVTHRCWQATQKVLVNHM